jgi:putative transposase
MKRKTPQQRTFDFRTWGGKRAGAGRKPTLARAGVPHSARPAHTKRHPVHVTLRAVRRLPSLRKQRVFLEMRRALARTKRDWFRVVHFSVQIDHVHLLVEADDKGGLSRGLSGAVVRLARAVNRVLERRGSIWADRYHARALATPREVRHALVYVLSNWQKHVPGANGLDVCSSAWLFDGWKVPPGVGPPRGWIAAGHEANEAPVAAPQTWLARTGWRRHGLISPNERPVA